MAGRSKYILKVFSVCLALTVIPVTAVAQLLTGDSRKEVNFREGPGMNFKIVHTIDKSNLLVILPGGEENGFVEVFDVETGSLGFVYESLIEVTDTLQPRDQNFFGSSEKNGDGDVEIILVNLTPEQLFFWINGNPYTLSPHEKKSLIFQEDSVTYFSSIPGLVPIYGKEVLEKGNSYYWNFSQ